MRHAYIGQESSESKKQNSMSNYLKQKGSFFNRLEKTEIKKIREEHIYKVVSWVLEAERTKWNPALTQRW